MVTFYDFNPLSLQICLFTKIGKRGPGKTRVLPKNTTF
jgi:hypothetical protein